MQYNSMQSQTMQYNAKKNTIKCNAMQHNAIKKNATQYKESTIPIRNLIALHYVTCPKISKYNHKNKKKTNLQLLVTKCCLRTDFSRPLSVVTDLPELDNALVVDGQHSTATLLTWVHDLGIQSNVVDCQVNVGTRPGQVPAKCIL